jgi:DNA-binding Xre family transcriptional regulator
MKLQRATALRISNLLIKNNMTRYALCKKIAMPEQTLKNIIDERNADIKLSTVAKIADGFDMSIDEFFKDSLFDRTTLDIE